MSKLEDSKRRAEEMKKLLDGPARNKIVRRYGAVEYRCERGCFLGAVVRHEGHEYLYTYSNTLVDKVRVTLGEHGQPIDIPQGTVAYDHLAQVIHELTQDGSIAANAGHTVEISVSTIADLLNLNPGAIYSRQRICRELPSRGVINCNCRHSEMAKTPKEIREDMRQLARSKKKLVYIDSNVSEGAGFSDVYVYEL